MAKKIIALNGSVNAVNATTIYTAPTGKVAQVTINHITFYTPNGGVGSFVLGSIVNATPSFSSITAGQYATRAYLASGTVIPHSDNEITVNIMGSSFLGALIPRQVTIAAGQTITLSGYHASYPTVSYSLLIVEEDA